MLKNNNSIGHDYIADLNEKVGFWKSISKSENYRMQPWGGTHHPIYMLDETKKEIAKYLREFCQKNSRLLSESSKIQTLYTDLENLCVRAEKFRMGSMPKFVKNSWLSMNYPFDYYLACSEFFGREQEIQQKRIKDIQAYIAYTQKQIDSEKQRIEGVTEDKNPVSLFERLFSSARSFVFKFSNPRYNFLKRIKQKEEKEIKAIELDLQGKAKEILQEVEKNFTPESKKMLMKSLGEIKKLSKEGKLIAGSLKSKLFEFKKAVSFGIQEQKKNVKPLPQIPEKTPEEKIQDALNRAEDKGENLILIGSQRSLGLVLSVIEKINEDEEHSQDILKHISGLLETPQGQDFGKSGNSRWKPVLGCNGIYELSVNPKTGHSQSMPRFYAKKELFTQNGELTNNKDKRPTENIWILVRKGSKRTQVNDMSMAEKVYFKNDGKPHDGQIMLNSLGWQKVSISPQRPMTPKKITLPNPSMGYGM